MSDAELDKLQAVPEISREELLRYFTLTPADGGFLAAHRRPANRLGLAVQLCTLPWLGFVPDNVTSAPAPAVARLAEHLGVAAEVLSSYGARAQARTDHRGEVAKFLRWRQAGEVPTAPSGEEMNRLGGGGFSVVFCAKTTGTPSPLRTARPARCAGVPVPRSDHRQARPAGRQGVGVAGHR
jgi:hypothetical protein